MDKLDYHYIYSEVKWETCDRIRYRTDRNRINDIELNLEELRAAYNNLSDVYNMCISMLQFVDPALRSFQNISLNDDFNN